MYIKLLAVVLLCLTSLSTSGFTDSTAVSSHSAGPLAIMPAPEKPALTEPSANPAMIAQALKSFGAPEIVGALGNAIDPVISIIPVLAPLAEKAYDNYVLAFKTVVGELSQKSLYCNNICNKGPACKVGATFRACKDACQTVKQISGYKLRIRFGDGWSLASCVEKGVNANLQTSAGRGNMKDIAIYSQEDLDYILKLLSYLKTSEEIKATNGHDLNLKGDEHKEAMILASKAIDDIPKHIDEKIRAGRFGNQ